MGGDVGTPSPAGPECLMMFAGDPLATGGDRGTPAPAGSEGLTMLAMSDDGLATDGDGFTAGATSACLVVVWACESE